MRFRAGRARARKKGEKSTEREREIEEEREICVRREREWLSDEYKAMWGNKLVAGEGSFEGAGNG